MMRVNSSTSNSRKYISRAVKVGIAVLIFFCVGKFLNIVLNDDTSSYTRITLHEMYEQDNIDILFLGSSHVYRSLDPKITDEVFQANTFNAGTSAQCYDGSYMLLKEADKYNDIKEVYMEMYYDVGKYLEKSERINLTSTYIISDYLKPSLDKYRYLLGASSRRHWVNSLFLPRRNWNKIFDVKYMSELYNKKQSKAYREYEYVGDEKEYYDGKGYVVNKRKVKPYHNKSNKEYECITEDVIKEQNKEDLLNILNYCKKHDIKLTMFVSPMPDFILYNVGNYDKYIDYIRELGEEYDIDFYDFNLCRPEYFNPDDSFFKDEDHLSDKGAETFSKLFSEFFTGKLDKEDVFYHSYEEKMSKIDFRLLGYFNYVDESDESNPTRRFRVSAVDHIGQKYRFTFKEKTKKGEEQAGDGEYELIRDFDSNPEIELDPEVHGTLCVELMDQRGMPRKVKYKI